VGLYETADENCALSRVGNIDSAAIAVSAREPCCWWMLETAPTMRCLQDCTTVAGTDKCKNHPVQVRELSSTLEHPKKRKVSHHPLSWDRKLACETVLGSANASEREPWPEIRPNAFSPRTRLRTNEEVYPTNVL
jgi:hypothetical protein